MKALKGKTAVIVGASSGIGRAIALTLARDGANLILAARREEALKELAQECQALGAAAEVVRTDVTHFNEVENLIGKAITFFGDIDIWINNAGVMAVGEFTDIPLDVHEQVIKTNLIGPLYGAWAIIPFFKKKRQGTLINTVSLGAYVPNPFTSSYSASKFGARALFDTIRDEIFDYPMIHVCDVNPSFTDTPGPLHAANFTGKELRPVPPLYDPFQIAMAIRNLILKPRPRIMVGNTGRMARLLHGVAPNFFGKAMAIATRLYLKAARDKPITQGNVFSPVREGTTARGGFMKRPSLIKFINERRFKSVA